MSDWKNTQGFEELLTRERERELLVIIKTDAPDSQRYSEALRELVESNMGEIKLEAASFAIRGSASMEDLISAGRLGFIRGIKRFELDHPKQTGLNAYAIWYSRQAMRKCMHGEKGVSVPTHLIYELGKYDRLLEKEPDLSRQEICERLKITNKRLRIIESARVCVFSADAPLHEDNDGSSFLDFLTDSDSTGFESPIQAIMRLEEYELVGKLVQELDDVQRDIIESIFLDEENVTLQDLSDKYGITREAIRQKRESALNFLRQKFEERVG